MNCTTKNNVTCCDIYDNNKNNSNTATKNNCTIIGSWPPQPYNDIYVSIMIVVILLVITANSYVIYKLKPLSRHSNIEILILYLSAFDMANILFLIADIRDNLTNFQNWPFGWFGCKLMYPSFNVLLCMSICVLIVMSVDRCRSIVNPIKKKFSKQSIHLAVLGTFVVSVLTNWFQFQGHTYQNKQCLVNKDLNYLRAKTAVTCVRDLIFLMVFSVTGMLIAHSLHFNSLLFSNRGRKNDVILVLVTMEAVFAILVIPYDVFDVAMMVSRLPGFHPIEFK